MKRRTFLLAAAASSTRLSRGAADRINVAIIGAGGRGRDHVAKLTVQPGCRVAAICDVNQAAAERGVAQAEAATGVKPKTYSDMRRVFEDREIDAVSMATPNHWHALGTIWACQAGKDVYVEKPACHNPYEGGKMIEAARKYGRMVQVGSQSRSHPHKIEAIRLLHEGVIGRVYLAKGLCYKRRRSIGRTPIEPVPAGLDWDRFLGPAPMRPYSLNRFRYNWHWFWDTGNGDIGNQGVHEMDLARWGLGVDLPTSVTSSGGKFVYDDDQETPNTQIASFHYGDKELVFEVRGILTNAEQDIRIGNLYYGSDGYMELDSLGYKVFKGESNTLALSGKHAEAEEWDPAPHFAAWLRAVRSRKTEDLTADVAIGVASADLCHLANISYRVGRRLSFDPAHMAFTGDSEADALLTRKYRSPYVVPEKV